ncbi:MAG: SDR family oxidoreductase [Betaproteobacteria bacterium]|nr:SDR family oxidoreductase [Betaproteobacteria bacterium]
MHSSTRILIIGFGDIGERVAKRLVNRYAVSALVRSDERANYARSMGIRVIRGDLSVPGSLRKLAGQADVVFHFAPPPGDGVRDTHTMHLLAALSWQPAHKSTRARMLSQLSPGTPRRLVYISTTGVYGDCGGAWIDETRPLKPATERAGRRVDAERQLRAWGRQVGAPVFILRAPGIYAGDRLPVERLRKGTAALVAEDDVFTNHIHAEDLARAAVAAMYKGKPERVYNVVDDTALPMADYFDRVADAFGLPQPPRISRTEAATRISPALLSFMSESRRIGNQRLKRELRFSLQYPTVDDFLREMKLR